MARLSLSHVRHEVPAPHAEVVQQRVESLLETFCRHVRETLQDRAGRTKAQKRARSYLQQRGVDLDRLDRLPVGLLADTGGMSEALVAAGFRPEEVEASKLVADVRLSGRLIGPIYDGHGHILSFWARDPENRAPKYLYKGKWKDEAGAFGLDVALPCLEQTGGRLTLVSDVLDTVLLWNQGFLSVAAIGGSWREMTSRRWQRLVDQGVREVTLVVCDGRKQHGEMLEALYAAFSAARSPRVFVAVCELPQGADSIADWCRDRGLDVLRDCLKCRVHAYHCKAIALLDAHRPDGRWTDAARFAALNAARTFYDSQVREETIGDLERFFIPPILEELGLRWDATPDVQEAACEELPEDETQGCDDRPVDVAPAGPPDLEIVESAENGVRREANQPVPVNEPAAVDEKAPRLLAEELPDHGHYVSRLQAQRFGLRQGAIPSLDRFGGGIRGLVLLAGPSGAAKTALALQIGTDMVRSNPETCLVFASAGLSRGEILSRLKSRLAGLDEKRLLQAYTGRIRHLRKAHQEQLAHAEEELADWGRRTLVLDREDCTDWSVGRVRQLWDRFKTSTSCPRGILVIDDVEIWVGDGRSARTRLFENFRHVLGDGAVIAVVGSAPPQANDALLRGEQCRAWRLSRLSDPAEASLLLRPWTAAELAALIDEKHGAGVLEREQRWRAELARRGWVLHKLEIRDLRQPGLAAQLDLTFCYRTWNFREGLPEGCRPPAMPTTVSPVAGNDLTVAQCGMPSKTIRQTVLQSSEDRPSPPRAEDPPRPLGVPHHLNRQSPGECTLHRCDALDCFCFD